MNCVALNRRGDPSRYRTHPSALTPNPCQPHKMTARMTPNLTDDACPGPESRRNGVDVFERVQNVFERVQNVKKNRRRTLTHLVRQRPASRTRPPTRPGTALTRNNAQRTRRNAQERGIFFLETHLALPRHRPQESRALTLRHSVTHHSDAQSARPKPPKCHQKPPSLAPRVSQRVRTR